MLPKKTQRLDFLPPGRFVGLDTLKLLATNHYVLHIKLLLFSHMLVLNIAIRMQNGRLVSMGCFHHKIAHATDCLVKEMS